MHLKLTGKRPCANAAIEWSTFLIWETHALKSHKKWKVKKTTVELEVNRLWHYIHSVLYGGNGNSVEAGKAGTSQSQQQAVMTIKLNDLVFLDRNLSSKLEKLKEWFYTILPLIVWHYLHLQELLFWSDNSMISCLWKWTQWILLKALEMSWKSPWIKGHQTCIKHVFTNLNTIQLPIYIQYLPSCSVLLVKRKLSLGFNSSKRWNWSLLINLIFSGTWIPFASKAIQVTCALVNSNG